MTPLLLLCALAFAQSDDEITPTEPAATESTDRARAAELFENGSKLYEEGAYESAIVAFRESYRLSKEPALFYNIANCLERMGQLSEARKELNTYRALAPAEEAERLDRRIAALDNRIEEQQAKESAPAQVAPATSAEPATVQTRKHPRWPLVVAGGLVAGLGGAGAGVTYAGSRTALDARDEETYQQQRTLNGVSWGTVGVGATVAILGFAIPASSPVFATPQGLGLRF